MKVFKFERSQVLSISLEKAWEYFSNPLNLAEITPPSLSLRIKGNFNGRTTNGMIIAYTVQPLFGIKMDWVSEIKHVQEPFFFVDEQRSGPYKFWYHQHFFKAVGKNQVEVVDVIYYALPLGWLAPLINKYIVQDKLIGIFNFRKYVLEQKFSKGQVAHEQTSNTA